MSKLTEKLIESYVVLYYYYLIDSSKGKSLKDVPIDFREEVELKANERYVSEYLKVIGENNV